MLESIPATIKMVKTSHEKHPYRTDEIEGELAYPPIVGASLVLLAPPLESGVVREVTTSPVVKIHWDTTGCHVETANSVYDLRLRVGADELSEIRAASEEEEETGDEEIRSVS